MSPPRSDRSARAAAVMALGAGDVKDALVARQLELNWLNRSDSEVNL